MYRTKKILKIIMMTTFGLLLSCSDEVNYHSFEEQRVNEMLLTAKELVQNQGNSVPLPINNMSGTESRSSLNVLAESTPLWDNINYYNIDGMQVLMVNLQTAEEILSEVSITENGETDVQESTTFSKLIIRKKGADIYAHVITYMPESNYASANRERLDTMGYYPQNVNFTGVTLSSHLDGTVYRGLRYDKGKIVGLITKYESTTCSHEHQEGEACTHNHDTERYNILNINLYSNTSTSNLSRGEDGPKCPECGEDVKGIQCKDCGHIIVDYGEFCHKCEKYAKVDGICMYCSYLEQKICSKCNLALQYCKCEGTPCTVCGQKECICPDKCDDCGQIKEACKCDPPEPKACDKCGMYPCRCSNPPSPDPTPIDTCDVCLTYPCKCCDNCGTFPCICVTNTTPIDYVAHERDWIVGEGECVNVTSCCPMAVLEMAHLALGGTGMTQEMFTQFYTQINVMSPEESTILEYNDGFMNQFFSTNSTVDISDDIELGNVVVIRRNGHYLLAFGLQYDGDVIYADLHAGELYAVNENYFNNCDYFTIDGLSSGGKDRKIQ